MSDSSARCRAGFRLEWAEWPSARSCGKRFDVGQQFHQVFFADLRGKRGHDRRISGDDLLLLKQDRIHDVLPVGSYRRTGHQVHDPYLKTNKPGRVYIASRKMTGAASVLAKQLLTLLRQRFM